MKFNDCFEQQNSSTEVQKCLYLKSIFVAFTRHAWMKVEKLKSKTRAVIAHKHERTMCAVQTLCAFDARENCYARCEMFERIFVNYSVKVNREHSIESI